MIGRVNVASIGFVAPGIDGSDGLAEYLDAAPVTAHPGWRASPVSLSARLTRRLSGAIALAVAAAEQVANSVPQDGGWVFASSLGEGDTLNNILASLSRPEVMVQPLRFQNAVHNAAQGQWSIASGGVGPGTSIAAHDDTAGAGLLKAAMQVLTEGISVGLVVFDEPLPEPLDEKRPMATAMAAALALSPTPAKYGALEISLASGRIDAEPLPVAIRDSGNPVRQILPLIAALASGEPHDAILSLPGARSLRARTGGRDAR